MKSGQMRRRNLPAYAKKIPYSSVCRMIDKAAYKFSKCFNLPFEEMQAEGNSLFIKAIYHFNPYQTETKFSSFLHIILQNGLISYGQAHKRKSLPTESTIRNDDEEIDIFDVISDEKSERQFAMVDFYQSLTQDEKELVDLVLMGFASTIGALKRIAIKRLHFNENQFNEAVDGIKEMLA